MAGLAGELGSRTLRGFGIDRFADEGDLMTERGQTARQIDAVSLSPADFERITPFHQSDPHVIPRLLLLLGYAVNRRR